MSLEEVEFLHDGQAAQQRLQAADPQQQARPPTDKRAPMIEGGKKLKEFASSFVRCFSLRASFCESYAGEADFLRFLDQVIVHYYVFLLLF